MRNNTCLKLIVIFHVLLFVRTINAEESAAAGAPSDLIKASMRAAGSVFQAGQPVWVEFLLTNLTTESLSLMVPETDSLMHDQKQPQAKQNTPEMGLPLSHVFSGKDYSAVMIENDKRNKFDLNVSVKPTSPVREIILAPNGSVGLRVELSRYYPSLLRPDTYTLVWKPYNGAIVSEPLVIHVLSERQAVISTDFGRIIIRFYYNKAPNHVQNFMELVNQRFYDNLTFHRVVAGGIIQGGCPRGDGYGIRKDKKRIKAEFNDIPFVEGTIGMARSESDPDSASCQFYISLNRQPTFDGRQTAFGHVVGEESFETLRKIASVPTDSGNRPEKPVYMRSVSLENVPARERTGPGAKTPGLPGDGKSGKKGGRETIKRLPSAQKKELPMGLSAVWKPKTRTQPARKTDR